MQKKAHHLRGDCGSQLTLPPSSRHISTDEERNPRLWKLLERGGPRYPCLFEGTSIDAMQCALRKQDVGRFRIVCDP